MPTFLNPFTPATQIGAGLQNIATGLFSGPGPYEAEKRRNESELYAAHTRLYGAQAEQVRTKMAADAAAEAQRKAAPLDLATQRLGSVPAAQEFQYRQQNPSFVGPPQYDPAEETGLRDELAALAMSMGLGDKNAANAGKYRAANLNERVRRDALAGNVPDLAVQRFGEATAAGEGKPLQHVMPEGTGSLFRPTAPVMSTLGTARAKEREAAAGKETALAGAANALTRQRDLETRTGVRIGPPVLVQDEEAGLTRTSPSASVGRPAGFSPKAPGAGGKNALELSYTGDDEEGNPQYEYVAKELGGEVTKAAKPIAPGSSTTSDVAQYKKSHDDEGEINAVIAGAYRQGKPGEVKDQEGFNAIKSRAQALLITPGSPYYGNATAAAMQAVKEIAPAGIEDNWFFKDKVIGGPRAPGATPVTEPTTRTKTVTRTRAGPITQGAATPAVPSATTRAAPPPEALARLKEGVVTRFANGTSWTLQRGVPVEVN